MRVLHLTTEYPPVIFGGLGTAVGGWVKASARGGLSVGVLLVEGPLVLDDVAEVRYGAPMGSSSLHQSEPSVVVDREGITFYRTSSSTAIEAGLRMIREWRPDVLHLHTAMLWWVAETLRAQTGLPLVYHVHSVDRAEYELGEEPNQWLAHSEAQEAAIQVADRLIALTHSERDLLETYYPASSARVRVAGNGIDDSELARAAAARQVRDDALMVLYSGRLVERKGIRELLSAVPAVLTRSPATRFIFAGGPPPLTGEQVAGQWLGPEHIPFRRNLTFTGWLRPGELAEWYAAADILVVPSRYEPFGMVILEGMLYGLPVVAADVGGPAEILEHERTGMLVPPRDVDAIAQTVLRLVEDPQLRSRIGKSAASAVRQRWAWPALVSAMREIYLELVSPLAAAPGW